MSRRYSGDGVFILTAVDPEKKNDEERPYRYVGRRYTLRGMEGDDNATVWQLKTDNDTIFNFLYNNADSSLTLLNDRFETVRTPSVYTLRP